MGAPRTNEITFTVYDNMVKLGEQMKKLPASSTETGPNTGYTNEIISDPSAIRYNKANYNPPVQPPRNPPPPVQPPPIPPPPVRYEKWDSDSDDDVDSDKEYSGYNDWNTTFESEEE